MRGRPLHITWQHTADELAQRLDSERNPRRRERIQALLMIRQGATMREASDTLGISYRAILRWVSWYRAGGLVEVLRRTPGHGAPGRVSKLTPTQSQELLRRYEAGQFRSLRAASEWLASAYGVRYGASGVHTVLQRARRTRENRDTDA